MKRNIREFKEVVYDEERWKTLKEKREVARKIMESLKYEKITSFVYGSIARGDVKKTSDVDVFIPYKIPSYKVETALEKRGFCIYNRIIIQATPTYGVKAYIFLDFEEKLSVSFPLIKLTRRELDFYKFGGRITLNELIKNLRVQGVDKRLMLIEPTTFGHIESPVIGREIEVARQLKISPDIVFERVGVLKRREEIGRTGVFIKYKVSKDESIESALSKIVRRNTLLRKLIRERENERK